MASGWGAHLGDLKNCSDEPDLCRLVAAFEDATNRHAVDELMAMFADNAEYELEGLTRVTGTTDIRPIFDYDIGVNGEIHFLDCSARAGTMTCQLLESNDRLRLAGIERLGYQCVLVFESGVSHSWRARPEPEPLQAFDRFSSAVRAWIAEHYARDAARMFTREGQFIRSRENGERIVQLGRQYRSMLGT